MKPTLGIWAFGSTATRFDAAGYTLDGHGSSRVASGLHWACYCEHAALGA